MERPSMHSSRSLMQARRARWILYLAVIGPLVLGVGLRLVDLKDPPMDFHPIRQLRSAIIARGLYYQNLPQADPYLRQVALQTWASMEVLEPTIFEHLVAMTYRLLGSEQVWVARLYAILFWVVGGLALLDLSRRLASLEGAVLAAAYYFLLPFGIGASRSFQPDPLMVMWIILAAWALFGWKGAHSWRWAVMAGLSGGLAVLVKPGAVFPVAAASITAVLISQGIRRLWRDPQVWCMVVLMISIPASYYLAGLGGRSFGAVGTMEMIRSWTLDNAGWLVKPRLYVFWLKILDNSLNLAMVFIGLAGIILWKENTKKIFVLALWIGYVIYGLAFPYHIHTHDYYSLMLVPILALSFSPWGALIFEWTLSLKTVWKIMFSGVVILAVAYPSWITYSGMIGVNYQPEAVGWRKIGEALPEDAPIIALTHLYGMPLKYYGWRMAVIWPIGSGSDSAGDRGLSPAEFEDVFTAKTRGMDYFLVTLFGELDAQQQLKAKLYENYPVAAEGDGFILFDLRQPARP